MQLAPGHESCSITAEETETIYRWGGGIVRHVTSLPTCLHDHLEDLFADDGLGSGPKVGSFCRCCEEVFTSAAYIHEGSTL